MVSKSIIEKIQYHMEEVERDHMEIDGLCDDGMTWSHDGIWTELVKNDVSNELVPWSINRTMARTIQRAEAVQEPGGRSDKIV